MGEVMLIDWIKVSEYAFSSGLTLGVSFATVWFTRHLRERKDKQREKYLDDVAALRGEGILLRNEGERENLEGEAFRDWTWRMDCLEDALKRKAELVSRVDRLRLEWLDRVEWWPYPHISNDQQRRRLWNLSGIIRRADDLLGKYRF
jgi:hypothetical protein